MNEPRYDKKVSWLAFNLSVMRFCRCAAGMEWVSDTRCEIDCLFALTNEDGLDTVIESGRDEEVVEE